MESAPGRGACFDKSKEAGKEDGPGPACVIHRATEEHISQPNKSSRPALVL